MLPLPILILIASQVCFTGSDLWARSVMSQHGFRAETFLSWWFLSYSALRTLATIGQLYGLSTIELGRATGVLSALSVLLANALGFFVLREVLTPAQYIGISLVAVAFLLLAR
jgi:drug/metabolite transporter (DMT)-like permease